MKAYGMKRNESPHRYLKRSGIPCPCCVFENTPKTRKSRRKRSRQAGKKEAKDTD